MTRSFLCLSLILCFSLPTFAQDKSSKEPITIAELRQRPVIGLLGVALGTVTEIDAVVIAGRDTRRKALRSSYLLKVTHVDGKKLNEPPTMTFNVGSSSTELANNSFSLYKMKHGKKTGGLTSAQILDLEKGYVGKRVRLVAYEVGSFHGVPSKLPDDVPIWQDFKFGFSTNL